MEMDLKNIQWAEFKISSIFSIDKGVYLNSKDITRGNVPYITAKSDTNGLNSFIGNTPLFKGNAITIEKINLSAYYQSKDFYCSHDVTVIRSDRLNKHNALFICNMINRQGFKYSYGRQAQMNVCKNEIIYLPITNIGEPNYAFMEQFMRQKEQEKVENFQTYLAKRIEQVKDFNEVEPLNQKEWGDFIFNELFEIVSTNSGIDKNKLFNKKGKIPYITRTDKNNGIDCFVGNQEKKYKVDNRNVITIGLDTQTIFYQQNEFYTGQNIQIISNKILNYFNAEFLIPLIKKQMEKFNWGSNGATLTRLKRSKILLTIDKNGKPDYDYMENYIKKLEYEKLTKYLKIKTTNAYNQFEKNDVLSASRTF